MSQREIPKREIAQKCAVSEVAGGSFTKEDQLEQEYLLTLQGRKLVRVNILGVIVSKKSTPLYEDILVDDGTGTIAARSFEKKKREETLSVGTIIQIIGKVRQYHEEKYVAVELITLLSDPRWLELRKQELLVVQTAVLAQQNREQEKKQETPKEKKEKTKEEEKKESLPPLSQKPLAKKEIIPIKGPAQVLYDLIKKLDKGEGAVYDAVVAEAKIPAAEDLLTTMLKNGDIFEIRPGKLKTLE